MPFERRASLNRAVSASLNNSSIGTSGLVLSKDMDVLTHEPRESSGNGIHLASSSGGSHGPAYPSDSHVLSGFTSTNGPIQNHLPFPNRQEHQPFNNQAKKDWKFDATDSSRTSGSSAGALPQTRYIMPLNRSFESLNILILVCHNREQKLLSDILIELQCLSFKFAVDISHVFQCLESKKDYNVLFLDLIYESSNLLQKLRRTNPSLLIIFLAEQQEPSPPVEDAITQTVLKPPTAHSLQEILQRYMNRGLYP